VPEIPNLFAIRNIFDVSPQKDYRGKIWASGRPESFRPLPIQALHTRCIYWSTDKYISTSLFTHHHWKYPNFTFFLHNLKRNSFDIQDYYKWFIRFQNSFLALSPFSNGTEFMLPTGARITNLVSLRFVSYINRICTCNTSDNIAFWKRMKFWKRMNHL
jgi:hypothetical protein